MDVKAAYLHGKIEKDIYMKQPPGFLENSQPDCSVTVFFAVFSAISWYLSYLSVSILF